MTEDEARSLITRVIGTSREIAMHRFEYGWLVETIPPARVPGEMPSDAEIGMASLIVDQSGVVTVQSSLPVDLTMEEYSAARRDGRIMGYQLWPEQTEDDRNR
jgi:hypothetical protein